MRTEGLAISTAGTDAEVTTVRGKVVRTKSAHNILTFLVVFGPGLIVMEANNDAGAVSTYVQAGALYGTRLLWLLLLLLPVTHFIQEMVVRLGIATGKGQTAMIYQRFGKWWGAFSLFDLQAVKFPDAGHGIRRHCSGGQPDGHVALLGRTVCGGRVDRHGGHRQLSPVGTHHGVPLPVGSWMDPDGVQAAAIFQCAHTRHARTRCPCRRPDGEPDVPGDRHSWNYHRGLGAVLSAELHCR